MLTTTSVYHGECVVLTTKHSKSIAAAPAFKEMLGAGVIEYPADTDRLGTFSGEVERESTPLACARRKCEWGLDRLNVPFGLSSEASFGPHPYVTFLPCGLEVLYFIDRRRGFHLHVARLSEETNYRTQTVDSFEELLNVAEQAFFPSHALIVRPNVWKPGEAIYKGIETAPALEEAFERSRRGSSDKRVWVETDMRAHFNPMRMRAIARLAGELAERLSMSCPSCRFPGWGIVDTLKGLPCELCGEPTEMTDHRILGCVKCDYIERGRRPDGLEMAPAMHCGNCNP
jgi:hypothetical protein